MEEIQAWMEWAGFVVAKAGLISWLSGNNEDADDGEVADAHQFVISALSDADKAREIEAVTGKNVRSGMTVQEIQEIEKELELRRFGGRRN